MRLGGSFSSFMSAVGEDPAWHVPPALQQFPVERAPAGALALDRLPETLRMIHVRDVHELVNDEVIHHFGTLEQQAGIEADGTAHRTTSPARTLPADRQALVGHAGRRGQGVETRPEPRAG